MSTGLFFVFLLLIVFGIVENFISSTLPHIVFILFILFFTADKENVNRSIYSVSVVGRALSQIL